MSVSIGDRVQVSFESARDGGGKATTRIGGRVAFTSGDVGQRGDLWLAEVEGENAKKTVYFLRLIRLVAAGDGLDEFLVGLSSYEIPRLREAHAVVQATLGSCVPGSIGLAAGLEHAVSNRLLPSSFRKKYLRQAACDCGEHLRCRRPTIDPVRVGTRLRELRMHVPPIRWMRWFCSSGCSSSSNSIRAIRPHPARLVHWRCSAVSTSISSDFADGRGGLQGSRETLSSTIMFGDRLAVCLYEQGRYKEGL